MDQYDDLPAQAPVPTVTDEELQANNANVEAMWREEMRRSRMPDDWFYIDTQGQEQGPFPLASLRAWFEAGYFPKEQRVLAKQGVNSEWAPMHDIEAIASDEPPQSHAPEPAAQQEEDYEKENEPEPQAGGGKGGGRKVANGRRAGSAGSDAPAPAAAAMPATKDVHKLFDRATPAGAALYALYNAEENESRTVGNAFSRRNAAMIAKQRVRRAGQPPEPEPEKEVLPGSLESRQVRVPKVGRRRATRGVYHGPARPSKKPADQIIGELVAGRESIISANQLEAQRVAVKTVDRDVEKRRLAKVNEMHGTDVKQMEQQIRVDARKAKAKSAADVIEDEFNQVMAEIEERHDFLAQMKALGKAENYDKQIKQEISERVAKMKVIDRQRTELAAKAS